MPYKQGPIRQKTFYGGNNNKCPTAGIEDRRTRDTRYAFATDTIQKAVPESGK